MEDPGIQAVISAGFVIILALLGWALRINWQSVNSAKNEINDLKVHVASECIKKTDYRADLNEIKGALRRIEELVSSKADKEA